MKNTTISFLPNVSPNIDAYISLKECWRGNGSKQLEQMGSGGTTASRSVSFTTYIIAHRLAGVWPSTKKRERERKGKQFQFANGYWAHIKGTELDTLLSEAHILGGAGEWLKINLFPKKINLAQLFNLAQLEWKCGWIIELKQMYCALVVAL